MRLILSYTLLQISKSLCFDKYTLERNTPMNKYYAADLKAQIVLSYLGGKTVSELARENNVSRSTIYIWIKEAQTKEDTKATPVNLRTFHDLKIKCHRLETIIEILKSAPCCTSAPLRERLKAIQEMSVTYNVNILCDALNVSKGTYYNHIKRNKKENTLHAQKVKELTPIIEEIYHSSKQTYGASRVHAVLKDRGYHIAENTVAKIMQKNGWFSVRGGAKALHEASKSRKENILNQTFTVSAPNEVWVSDVTIFEFKKRKYYICIVLDLYARKVVSHTIALNNSTQLTKRALIKAYNERQPKAGLLFHSDQGANYTSKAFQSCAKGLNITQSFSRASNPFDNSVMEAFNKTLKHEELYRRIYHSEQELKDSIARYINFYNSERIHSMNFYRTPDKYEEEYYTRQCD